MSDMSEKNVALVKQGYAAFERDDIPAVLALLADDVEFVLLMSPDEFIASGDRVVVLGHQAGRARSTGRHGELAWVHVYTVRDGKISRFDEFLDSYTLAQLWESPKT
ncbi:MAG: nuclear transport factor 2 family protein [bacterium]